MPRTLKNNDSLLNFFVGREAFSPVWSEGQVVQMGPGDQASQGGPGGQVVRWSGGQVKRVVKVDNMLSENMWFSCPKSSNN